MLIGIVLFIINVALLFGNSKIKDNDKLVVFAIVAQMLYFIVIHPQTIGLIPLISFYIKNGVNGWTKR